MSKIGNDDDRNDDDERSKGQILMVGMLERRGGDVGDGISKCIAFAIYRDVEHPSLVCFIYSLQNGYILSNQ